MTKEPLKPCPFCGGEAVIVRELVSHVLVTCSRIDCCDGPIRIDEATAIKAWNKRKEVK